MPCGRQVTDGRASVRILHARAGRRNTHTLHAYMDHSSKDHGSSPVQASSSTPSHPRGKAILGIDAARGREE
eukprot:11181614-Lingulodinium_polyedra.AAC.1